jgi:hypothetical protein
VAFSFTSNLLAGLEAADGFAALFQAFGAALDERQISYLQGTLQLVADCSMVGQIRPYWPTWASRRQSEI